MFIYSASNQQRFVFIMKRVTRRKRSTSMRQTDNAAQSMSCQPGSLCRGLPPSSPSEVSRGQMSFAEFDEINHVDRLDGVEQRGKNGLVSSATLLGGNRLQQYDQFIATLLRERAVVKDGVAPSAADEPKSQVSKPRSLTARLRKQHTASETVDDKLRINGTGASGFRMEAAKTTRKSVGDRSLLLKSAEHEFLSAANKSDEMNIRVSSFVPERRPENKVNGCRSPAEAMDGNVARRPPINVDTTERSQRQRQRRKRRSDRHQYNGLNANSTAQCQSEGCHTAASDAPVQLPQRSATAVFNNSRTETRTHSNQAVLDRRLCGLDESSAFRDRFDECDAAILHIRVHNESRKSVAALSNHYDNGLPTQTDEAVVDQRQDGGGLNEIFPARDLSERCNTVALHSPSHVDYQLSQRRTTTVSNDSEPTQFDKADVGQRNEEGVFGLSVGMSEIKFIDCDHQRIEQFDDEEVENERQASLSGVDRRKSSSLMMDRWRNVGDDMSASSPRLDGSSVQLGCHVTGACTRGNLRVCRCAVCRRAASQWNAAARLRRECRSQPSLSHSQTDQASSAFDESPDQLNRDEAHRSPLLETCQCSIAWATTAVPYVVKTEITDDDARRPPQLTHGLVQSDNATAMTYIPTSLQLNVHKQQPAGPLPSHNIPQPFPWRSCNNERRFATDKISVDQHSVKVLCCRRRQNGSRCGGKASRCLLSIEFMLTRLKTRDQNTTLFVAQKTADVSAAKERDQLVTGDSDVENLPLCRCSTTTDVVSDYNDDVINDNKENADLARNCSAVGSLTTSQLCAIKIPRDQPSSTVGTVCRAANTSTVDDVTPCNATSGDIADVSQSLTVCEFAEVTSIFRNFADDLMPTTDTALSLVPHEATRRREGRATSTALVRRARPGVTYCGAVVPYGTTPSFFVPLPLMTWTWNHDDVTGSRLRATSDDVIHIPYVSACTTINTEPFTDNFTLITRSSCDVVMSGLFQC